MSSVTTLNIKDAAGNSKPVQVVDVSGTGVGPFVPLHALLDASGNPYSSANPLAVSVKSLPADSASATKQDAGNTSLASIDTKTPTLVGGRIPVDGSAVTQPVSATSLPLPTGAATSANQTAIAASVASLDTKAPALANGRVPVDGSGVTQPVSGTVAVGSMPPLPVGANKIGSVDVATLPALPAGANAIGTVAVSNIPNVGVKASTLSFPVVLASDQAAIPVTGTFFQATQPVSGTVAASNIPSLGIKAAAGSLPVVLASDQAAIPVTGTFFQATQPVSGTVAASNIPSVGTKTAAGSLPVVLASDQAAVPVTGTFFQATQPVSGTISVNALPALAAGTNSIGSVLANLQVSGAAVASGNPIPVSQASVPTGASTSTLQNTIITNQNATAAGTSATNAQAVQGVTGGVPMPTTIRSAGTNRSGGVTTTAANLMAANATRQGWKIKNDSTVTIWINFDATATAVAGSGNFAIPAGGYLSSEPGFVETGAMSAISTSGTANITAREY